MTKKEAEEIISLLKSGQRHKSGHYQYGYEYYWYDKSEDNFCYKMEDLAMNIFEPDIREKTFSEKEFLKELLENKSFESFDGGGLSFSIPKSELDSEKPDNIHK